jgi:beta-glucosidase
VVAGLRDMLPKARVLHARASTSRATTSRQSAAALDLCAQADAIVLCWARPATMSGEAASRAHPGLPGGSAHFAEAVFERAGRCASR